MSSSVWSVSMGAGRVELVLSLVFDVASVDNWNRASRLMFGSSSKSVSSLVDSEFWLSIDPRARCFFFMGELRKVGSGTFSLVPGGWGGGSR